MKNFYNILMILLLFVCTDLVAKEYSLSIQPALPQDVVIKKYQPLADYLSRQTGHTFKIKAYKNYFIYWQKMKRKKGFDFVLDAAHFTDYRVQKKNYSVLAKMPDTVTYSVVTHKDVLIQDMDELVLKRIATMTSPGLGGIQLYQIFSNPTRLPIEVTVNDSDEAVSAVVGGQALAAIIPTPLVEQYENLHTVITTKPVPDMGFSVSPNVPEVVKRDVRHALVNAYKTNEGRELLKMMKLEKFETTSHKTYQGYAGLLKGLFGYVPSKTEKSASNI